jgi:AcrR family transcriptional regulator
MDTDRILDHEKAERILVEGWALFQQKGYRGVTIDELCARCELTKPTLYYYFRDKEHLFVSVLQYRLKGFHEVIDQPGPLVERLERIAVSILESFQAEYNVLLRDREHIKDPEALVQIRDAFHRELFEPLIHLMKSGIDTGELVSSDPQFLSLIFMGIVNNFIGHEAEFQMDTHTLAHDLVNKFLKGVKK